MILFGQRFNEFAVKKIADIVPVEVESVVVIAAYVVVVDHQIDEGARRSGAEFRGLQAKALHTADFARIHADRIAEDDGTHKCGAQTLALKQI